MMFCGRIDLVCNQQLWPTEPAHPFVAMDEKDKHWCQPPLWRNGKFCTRVAPFYQWL